MAEVGVFELDTESRGARNMASPNSPVLTVFLSRHQSFSDPTSLPS